MSVAVAVQYDRRGGGREGGNNLNFVTERGYSDTRRTTASSLVSPRVA